MTFDYNVKFPLSLIISRKTVFRYQLLFRFSCISNMPSMCFLVCGPSKRQRRGGALSPPILNSSDGGSACLLRARMLAFVQQILAFVTFEVLEPN